MTATIADIIKKGEECIKHGRATHYEMKGTESCKVTGCAICLIRRGIEQAIQGLKDIQKRGEVINVVNLNDMARRITLKEGGKVSLPIGQVKEVMKLTMIELAKCSDDAILMTVNRYGDGRKD